MSKIYILLLLFFLSLSRTDAQVTLVIKGEGSEAATLVVENGVFVIISGGIIIDGSASPAVSSNSYLQNNGTILINSGNSVVASNFINNVPNLKTYTSGETTGEIIFNANNLTQSVIGNGSVEFMNLRVNNLSIPQVELFQNVSVAGSLNISGLINIRENNLSLLSTGILAGQPYSSANMIQADNSGEFIRAINIGSDTYLFPVGDGNSNYSPVSLSFITNADSGKVGVKLKPITHPHMDNPEAVTDFLSRYWTISNQSLSNYSYSVDFAYLNQDINGIEPNIKLNRWDNQWISFDESVASLNSLSSTGVLDNTAAPLTADFTGRFSTACAAVSGEINVSNTTICKGDLVNLFVEGNSGEIQWQTSSTEGNFVNIDGASNNTYNPALMQSAYFRVYASLGGNCVDTSEVVFINVIDAPVAGFNFEQNSGFTVEFFNNSSFGSDYQWDFGGGNSSSQENPEFTYPFDGIYPVTLIVSNPCGSDTITVMIEVFKLSVDDLANNGSISIFPNPFNNQIQINIDQSIVLKNMNINVFNMLGQTVYSSKLQYNTHSFIIELNKIPGGIYTVQLCNDGTCFNKKIIKN